MFHLVTGALGTGKTLTTLLDVRERSIAESRPVYYFNIALRGEALSFGWIELHPHKWEEAQRGAIFLIDEAHKYFPARSGNKDVPAYVQNLAEHRSMGFDFYLITQHPADLDIFIRRRVADPGWHRHLKRRAGAQLVSVLQFNTVKDQPEKMGSGADALVSTRSYPKHVYEWYHSADLHTAKFRMPKQLLWLVYLLLFVACAAWWGWTSFQERNRKPVSAPEAAKPAAAAVVSSGDRGTRGQGRGISVAEYVALHNPRIMGLEHTAPLYDGLTSPTRVPVPAACLRSGSKGCKCFTQDGTPYRTTEEVCRQVVDGGLFLAFEPTRDGRHQAAAAAAGRAAVTAPSEPQAAVHDGRMLAAMRSGNRQGPQ